MSVAPCNCVCCRRFLDRPIFGEYPKKAEDQRYLDAVNGIRQMEKDYLSQIEQHLKECEETLKNIAAIELRCSNDRCDAEFGVRKARQYFDKYKE